MAQVTLKAEERKLEGKGTLRALRRANKIPAVLYGKNFQNKHLAVSEAEFLKAIRGHGESVLIDLSFNSEKHTVIIKEIQRDLLENAITHIDFYKVSMNEKIEVEVPILLKGEPEGVKMGGVLQHQLDKLTVEALPQDIPEHIEVDISALKIGDVLTVKEIKLGEKITVLDDPEEIVVAVLAPAQEEEEGAKAGVEEPEVIAKGKEKKQEE